MRLLEFGILTGPSGDADQRTFAGALSVWLWRNDSSGDDESALMR